MRRTIIVAAVAAASLLVPGTAMAGNPAPDQTLPPAFVPPTPAPVVDNDTAGAFARLYVARNASRFIGSDRRRTRVLDVNAACLTHPVIATRFGCVFTLRAAVFSGRSHGYSARVKSRSGHGTRRVRVRNFGCLGALTINGGPTVQPVAQVRFVECARVPRGDYNAPEPEPVS